MFACSYSIAGLNVLSGNPADHLVHRHTHRVVRGSLLVCGRPDGRLSALSTAEASVCLSVNQASSIQSWGGTCESITIGHNPVKLPLTKKGIFLKRKRPLFLCERMLVENDSKEQGELNDSGTLGSSFSAVLPAFRFFRSTWRAVFRSCRRGSGEVEDQSFRFLDASKRGSESFRPQLMRRRSAATLIGAYTTMEDTTTREYVEHHQQRRNNNGGVGGGSKNNNDDFDAVTVDTILAEVVEEKRSSDEARNLFDLVDRDGDGLVSLQEFLRMTRILLGRQRGQSSKLSDLLREFQGGMDTIQEDSDDYEQDTGPYEELFSLADVKNTGLLDYRQFLELWKVLEVDQPLPSVVPTTHRNAAGAIEIASTRERYFGEKLRRYNSTKPTSFLSETSSSTNRDDKDNPSPSMSTMDFWLAKKQHFAHELYETRIASLQRFVAMTVMFHQMGARVEAFFPTISCGLWGYRTDRTHSGLRIATTASPISGSDVQHRIRRLLLAKKVKSAVATIESFCHEHVLDNRQAAGSDMTRQDRLRQRHEWQLRQRSSKAIGVTTSTSSTDSIGPNKMWTDKDDIVNTTSIAGVSEKLE